MNYLKLLRTHLIGYEKSGYIDDDVNEDFNTRDILDCSFGVNPFGYSPLINKHELIDKCDINNYTKFPFNKLTDLLIDFWSDVCTLTNKNLRITSGSMVILNRINALFLNPNDKTLGYVPQFPGYINSVKLFGGHYDYSTLKSSKNYKFSANDVIKQIQKKDYKFIFLDNPNNPTGQIIDISEIERVVEAASLKNTLVIIDEAYGEYMSKYNSAINILSKYENLIVVRSFSKGYGLASLRVGYVVSSENFINSYKIIDDYLVNSVGIEAAKIALSDYEFIENSIKRTKEIKSFLIGKLKKFQVLETNFETPIFVLVHPDPSVNLKEHLLKYDVIASSGFKDLGKNSVRIRIPKDYKKLLSILLDIEATIN